MGGLKVNYIYRDFRASGDSSDDAAMARLRTSQMLRAVRVAAGLAATGPAIAPRAVHLSGDLLADDDPGGDGARIIDGEARVWASPFSASRRPF